jgi:hyperosmotically inducible protein
MLRIISACSLALVLCAGIAAAENEEKKDDGVMERTGAAIDESLEATRDFFTDSRVTARVKKRLLKDEHVSGLKVNISTTGGVVMVAGEVDSEEIAQRVMDIVRATKGVSSAENHMVVVSKRPSAVE